VIQAGINSAFVLPVSRHLEDKMKILTGILFLIIMIIAPLSASAEIASGGGIGQASAEQQEPSGEGEETSDDEEEPDCD